MYVISESGAIIGLSTYDFIQSRQTHLCPFLLPDYILNTYSSPTPSFSLQDSYFSHYAEGTLMLFLQMGRVLEVSAGQAPWLVKGVCEKFADGIKVSLSLVGR